MERTISLNALSSFDLVASKGGFGRAAAASGQPKATLSRRVRALEEVLALRLINRDGRAFALTEEGRLLHARTHELLTEIGATVADLTHESGPPRGRLRVSCPMVFAHQVMGRAAAEFMRAFPAIELEITVEDREVDLIEEGYDVVIRVNPRADTRLVGRCILRNRLHLIASPDLPLPPDETNPVPVVARTGAGQEQQVKILAGGMEKTVWLRASLSLPSLLMQRDALFTGGLAAVLPRWLVAEDLAAGRLSDWGPLPVAPAEVWVLHASRRLTSRKIKVFVDFLAGKAAITSPNAGFSSV